MNFSKWSSFNIIYIWVISVIYTHIKQCKGDAMTSVWKKVTETSANMVCAADAIKVTQVSSAAKCTEQSSREPGCTSFTYTKDMVPNCYMLPTIPLVTDGCVVTTNAKTFVNVAMAPGFTCPPNDGQYHTFLLDDYTVVTYRIVRSSVNIPTASVDCASSGGVLAKVSTLAKLNLLTKITQTCADFSNHWYWIDGRIDANNVWRWSDDEPINMNSSFWGTGRPNSNTEDCVLFDYNLNWKFNDGNCDGHFWGFVCQKQ